ncbi:MAG: EAL domain-containing protein [Thioalkalispiraceae bacterium]
MAHNFGYMESTFNHATQLSDIAAIYILDKNHDVLTARIDHAWRNTDFRKPSEHFREFTAEITRTETVIDDLEGITQSDTGNEVIGHVRLIMSLAKSRMLKRQIIKDGVFLAIISTLATILVALLFARSITKPIQTIKQGVDLIGKGNLHHRIPIKKKGEIADLADGINKMSASLEIAQIKEKQRAEDKLFIEKTKAQITLQAIGEGVITTDTNGLITYLNPAAEHLTGFSMQYALNKPLSSIFRIKESATNKNIDYPIMDCINAAKKIHHESNYILMRNDDAEYAIRETATPLFNKEQKVVGAVLVFHDFTSIKKMSDVLTYQATHDDLTGLINRRAFETRIESIINNLKPDQTHTLCYVDLDQFKIVNDTCGHVAGDNLLKIVANNVQQKIRRNDLFARIGGDEFAMVLVDCNIQKAHALAESIKNTISGIPFTWDNHSFKIGCSIGIVQITSDSNLTDIMIAADTACYIAKEKGRNRIHAYNIDDDIISQKQGELRWFQRINSALEHDQFILYSQQIASFSQGSHENVHEILVRMIENDELINPGAFIYSAERYNLMPKIDRWVISTLFSKIQNAGNGYNDLVYSINLSGQTLGDDTFTEFLDHQFEMTGINPGSIIFEITETSAISNYIDAIEFISYFKEKGCRFALDDFGSGMCSFQYLNEFPVDYLKIDGNFVKNIDQSAFNKSVIESISQIGHSLGLKIVAEFVENQSIMDCLDTSLIDYVQGYAIEYPRPVDDLFDLCRLEPA